MGDAANVLAAAAGLAEGNVTPPGGIRVIADGGVLGVLPQPVLHDGSQAAAGVGLQSGDSGPVSQSGAQSSCQVLGQVQQAASRPDGDGGGVRTSAVRGEATIPAQSPVQDAGAWGMPDLADLDVLIANGSVAAFMAFAPLPTTEFDEIFLRWGCHRTSTSPSRRR